jgi:hypothetical protein
MSEYGIRGFNLELLREPIMTDITIDEKRAQPPTPAALMTYFSPRDSTLVIVAYKLGSRFFENYLGIKKKYRKLDVDFITDTDTIEILHSFKRKILFYRDPLDRFLGWYRSFIFVPHQTHGDMMEDYEYDKLSPEKKLITTRLTPLLKQAAFKCTLKKSFIENAYNFLMEEDPLELENLLYTDGHTVPLYNFFEYTKMDPLNFHIFNMSDIGEFTLDRFGSWERQFPQSPITVDKKTLTMLLELHDRLHVIYKNDYDILGPLVKKYPQEGI